MISSPSRLPADNRALVLDASVVINLLGTGRPADLLRILGRRVIIEEIVYGEVTRDPFDGKSGGDSLDQLVAVGLLKLERLSAEGYDLFLDLTGAEPPDDLGDGEAATIAHSIVAGAIPVLDERKGARIAGKRGLLAMSTVDLLCSQEVAAHMPQHEISDVVYAALKNARMRVVSPDHGQWVVDMIGPDRAASCPSLRSVACRKNRDGAVRARSGFRCSSEGGCESPGVRL